MKEYTVTIGGIDHTMQLDDDDAKRQGLLSTKQADAPKNKAASAKNKG